MNPTNEQLADPKWWEENAVDGATHYDSDYGVFFTIRDKGFSYMHKNDGFTVPMPVKDEVISKMIPRPVKQWTGQKDGLPPIGVCVSVVGDVRYGEGESGEVIGHIEDCAIVRMSYGPGCFTAAVLAPAQKTPEQLAAEEREKECRAMAEVLKSEQDSSEYYAAKALYDAGFGYRKQPSQPAQDMTDWRNWRVGDLVECLTDEYVGVYTKGKKYKIRNVHCTYLDIYDDCGKNSSCVIVKSSMHCFRWHSRPSA